MVESTRKKRNSLTLPFGLRIPQRSNSIKSNPMTAPVDGPSSGYLARGNSTRSKTQQEDPITPGSFFINVDAPVVDPDSVTVDYSSVNVREGGKSRAQPLIHRMEGWQLVLREILSWLESVGKINMQSSEIFYHRILPHVDWTDSKVKRGTPLSSIMYGFRSLTARVASSQQEAGNTLLKEYIPELEALVKDCKRRVLVLEQDRQLRMGELLRRADATQKSIALLNRQCQAAMSTGGNVSQDPWLTNLHVLRHLQREVQEDNRLRTASIDIQRQVSQFEQRVILALKKAVQYCFDHYGPIISTREVSRIQHTLEKMDPQREWQQFMAKEASDLVVDENEPPKDYLHIRYSNRFHPAVMTLHKGRLERRTGGVRKQYSERYYVLTQCGYLHQFNETDKVNPELSIYIPKSTIVPSIDISHLSEDVGGPGTQLTVEIRRAATLQRDKSYVLRARSREELVTWCRLLVDVATRHHGHATWKKIQRRSTGPSQGDLRIDTSVQRSDDSGKPSGSLPTPKSPANDTASKHEVSTESVQHDSQSSPKSDKGKERSKDVGVFEESSDEDEPLDQIRKATPTDSDVQEDQTPVKVIEPLFRNSDPELKPVVTEKPKQDEPKEVPDVDETPETPKASSPPPQLATEEPKPVEDIKAAEKPKPAEEIKTVENHKPTEEAKTTEETKTAEETKASDEPKVTEEPNSKQEATPTKEEPPAPVSFLSYIPQLNPFSPHPDGNAQPKGS